MKKRFVVLLALLIALIFAGTAAALEFSADMVSTAKGGRAMTSKIYMKGNKMRFEAQNQDSYTISRQDMQTTWVVMPKQKTYMEMKAVQNRQQVPQEKLKGEVSRKLIGPDTIDGHPTKKYEVTVMDGKRQMTSYQWLATDMNNFPIKSAAVDGRWGMEYRNIKLGSQPDSLFEVPSGFKKTSFPGVPGRPRR